jgi:hypothetical protein
MMATMQSDNMHKNDKDYINAGEVADVDMHGAPQSPAVSEDFFPSPSPSPPPKTKAEASTMLQESTQWGMNFTTTGTEAHPGNGRMIGGLTLPTTIQSEKTSNLYSTREQSVQEVPSHGVLLTTVSTGPLWPSLDQLDVAHSYGVRRGDGLFTRLVRADELPSNVRNELGIPERQGPEGLILVPQPHRPLVPVHPIPIVSKAVMSSSYTN